jgi:PAS domain S-box-containing protein
MSDLPTTNQGSAECAEIIAALEQQVAGLRQSEVLLNSMLDSAPDGIVVIDEHGRMALVNRQIGSMFGYTADECLGEPVELFIPAASRERHVGLRSAYIAHAYTRPMAQDMELVGQRKDGSAFPVEISLSPLKSGDATWVVSIVRDISERRRLEQSRKDLQAQIIQSQQDLLHELSTPLFPIYDEVLLLPLVGRIDEERARQCVETLLRGIRTWSSRFAIIDITGVPMVDSHVAEMLVNAATAARLLGTQVILTGIRPEIAVLLVDVGLARQPIITHGALRDGLATALAGLGKDVAAAASTPAAHWS